MNIFAVSTDPDKAAKQLPDKHVTKMILESAQMLSIVFSKHYWDIGEVMKVDGTPFKTAKGAFKNHPCTIWAADKEENCAWLIHHAICLCDEFEARFGKRHGLAHSLFQAKKLFHRATGRSIVCFRSVTDFARAMPEQWKFDDTIDDVTAYRRYMNSKEWCYDNYNRIPSRRPDWLHPPEND
jgi:hypothetical protein